MGRGAEWNARETGENQAGRAPRGEGKCLEDRACSTTPSQHHGNQWLDRATTPHGFCQLGQRLFMPDEEAHDLGTVPTGGKPNLTLYARPGFLFSCVRYVLMSTPVDVALLLVKASSRGP